MVITDYRIRSVLRTHSRQLQRSRFSDELEGLSNGQKAPAERVTISEDARHHFIMERMTSQVLEKAYPKQGDS
jgi:uncharacterized protein (DUF1786 family)